MRFRLRDRDPGEMIAREPGMRVLEITREWGTAVFPLAPEDLAALNALALAVNSHQPLPIEAGEP